MQEKIKKKKKEKWMKRFSLKGGHGARCVLLNFLRNDRDEKNYFLECVPFNRRKVYTCPYFHWETVFLEDSSDRRKDSQKQWGLLEEANRPKY